MVAARYREDGDSDDEEFRAVIDRYERLLDVRARLRRETNPDEEFVWTANRGRE